MSTTRGLLSIFAWDGVLPVLVAITPMLIRALFRPGQLVEVIAAVLLPIALALLRIHIGAKQLARATGGNVGVGRQLVLAAAIILLLLFEMYSLILFFAKGEPSSAWLVPGGLWVAYVVAIWFAIRPNAGLQS